MQPSKIELLSTAVALALYGGASALAEVKITSDDGRFETRLGGRVQVDAAWYDEDNVDLDGENGTEFRRARLFVQGTMYDVWDTSGGREENITVGVNWYATRYMRFMANYVHADAERLREGLITPAYDDDSPDIYEMRAQIDF